jgi:hypothetical protein
LGTSEQGFIERLVGEEIRRMVAEAINDGGVISTSKCAAQISRAYAGSVFISEAEIADKVIMAAASAGVAVEIDRPAPPQANPVVGPPSG